MMQHREQDTLKQDEGLRLKPYLDSEGVWTIGHGHNLTVGGISRVVADLIFQEDFERTSDILEFRLPDLRAKLSPARWGVLLNMGFNLGAGGLLRFPKFLAALRAEDWEEARKEMLDSKWARQVGARANRLSRRIVEDLWV